MDEADDDTLSGGDVNVGLLWNAVRRAWPEGLAPEDRAILARLSPDDQHLVERRLTALLEVEAGARAASHAPTNDARGMTNSGFQSLVRRWKENRCPRTIVPYAGRAARGPVKGEERRRLGEEIDRLLGEPGPLSLVSIARIALRRTGVELALNSALVVARERRGALRRAPAWLSAHYGHRLLCDVSALGFECGEPDGAEPAVIAATVEQASGLILGHAVAGMSRSLELQRSALAQALGTLVGGSLDVVLPDATVATIVLGTGRPEAIADLANSMRDRAPNVLVVAGERRRIGDRLFDVLDGVIDGLPLHPRGAGARRVSSASATPWPLASLVMVAGEAVAAHNRARFERLIDAGAIAEAHRVPLGSMVDVLTPLVGALQPRSDMTG